MTVIDMIKADVLPTASETIDPAVATAIVRSLFQYFMPHNGTDIR